MRFLLLFILFSASIFASQDGWIHLELGAGNYGKGDGDYDPEDQYGILFWTLDELVSRYGETGVFQINDYNEDYAEHAVEILESYARQKGYTSLLIEMVFGDYHELDPSELLSKYDFDQYTSVHLKHPELKFYYDKDEVILINASEKAIQETRDMMQKFADHSSNGLCLFILYYKRWIPELERNDFNDTNLFYHTTDEWEKRLYYFPYGNPSEEKRSKVFQILGTTS